MISAGVVKISCLASHQSLNRKFRWDIQDDSGTEHANCKGNALIVIHLVQLNQPLAVFIGRCVFGHKTYSVLKEQAGPRIVSNVDPNVGTDVKLNGIHLAYDS